MGQHAGKVVCGNRTLRVFHACAAVGPKDEACRIVRLANDGEPCGYTPTRELYDKYCNKLGIIKKSSHKARKTYISSLLDGNVNVNSVREMAGHRDERTTLSNYYFDRSSDEEKKKMIEAALAI